MTTRPTIATDIRPRRSPAPHRGYRPLPTDVPARKPIVVHTPKPQAKTQQPATSSRAKIWNLAQYPLIAAGALAAAASTTIGQILILLFALTALAFRQTSSRTSFSLALILVLATALFELIRQPDIAHNASVYAYEFLVLGALSAILELKPKSVAL